MSEITTKTQRVGDIFRVKNDTRHEVPVYQRGYSWENKQIEDFCDDLWELDVQPGSKQPFGIMFIQKISEGGFEKIKIIDGQQRTSTVATFICVVRDYIDENQIQYPSKLDQARYNVFKAPTDDLAGREYDTAYPEELDFGIETNGNYEVNLKPNPKIRKLIELGLLEDM